MIDKIYSNGEISKALSGGVVVYNRVINLSDPILWTQGGFDSSTGANSPATSRIRTKDFIPIEDINIKMNVVPPYTVAIMYCKADGSFISFGVRASEVIETPPAGATKFKISIAKGNNLNLTPAESANANPKMEFL